MAKVLVVCSSTGVLASNITMCIFRVGLDMHAHHVAGQVEGGILRIGLGLVLADKAAQATLELWRVHLVGGRGPAIVAVQR